MKIVILEGIDGTGKSTIARALCDIYGCRYVGVGPPPPKEDGEKAEHYSYRVFRWYLNMVTSVKDDRPMIFDRFHLGSFVYGNVFRGGDDLQPVDRDLLEDALNSLETTLFWIDVPVNVTIDRIRRVNNGTNADPEHAKYEDPTKQIQLAELFGQVFSKSKLTKARVRSARPISVIRSALEDHFGWRPEYLAPSDKATLSRDGVIQEVNLS